MTPAAVDSMRIAEAARVATGWQAVCIGVSMLVPVVVLLLLLRRVTDSSHRSNRPPAGKAGW